MTAPERSSPAEVKETKKASTAEPQQSAPKLVAVLDMGASAIRLAIAELAANNRPRIIEEASKGVLLGRDTFSLGAIRSQTIDAAIAALSGFRQIMKNYGVEEMHAVATSAVREARNGDMFLDRIQARTGVAFEVINEAEEGRLVFLAVRDELSRHAAFRGRVTLLAEVGGGSTSLTLLRGGEPSRSGRVRAGRGAASTTARPAPPQPGNAGRPASALRRERRSRRFGSRSR